MKTLGFSSIRRSSSEMKCIKFRQKNESGQAVIEFIFGLMIAISFFFFFVRMSALFAVGNYIHYATFMAARAYASSAKTQDIQEESARSVLSDMVVGKFKNLIRPKNGDGIRIGAGPYYEESGPEDYWNQGAAFNFSAKLSLYPWNKENQAILLDLTSESSMPREVTEAECLKQKQMIGGLTGVSNIEVEWDNGC